MPKRQRKQTPAPKAAPQAALTKRPRRMILALLVTALLVVGATASWKYVRRQTIPIVEPPTIKFEGVDPAVVKAIDKAREEVNASPRDSQSWGELGMTLLAHEFNSAAAICFDQAAALDGNDVRWPYFRAKSVAMQNPKEAVTHLESAVLLCGNDPAEPRLTMIELLLELLELDTAEQQLASILSSDKRNARARLAKGRLLFMRGEYQASLDQLQSLDRDLTAAKRFIGQKRSLHLLIAETLRRLGRADDAERTRERAMAESDLPWSDELMDEVHERKTGLKKHLVQADLLFGKRQYEESINLLRRTIEQYPDSLWGKILLARALIRTGAPDSRLPAPEKQRRLQQAVQQLQEALERDPRSVEAQFRLAVAKTYQGDLPGARELYLSAIRLKPDFAMAHYNLASCLHQLRDKDGAMEALRASIEAQPDFVDGHYLLGRFLLNDRKYAEAAQHLKIAAQLNPADGQIAKFYQDARQMSEILQD